MDGPDPTKVPRDLLRSFLYGNTAKGERSERIKEERLFRASITKEDRAFAAKMRNNAATKIQAAARRLLDKLWWPFRKALILAERAGGNLTEEVQAQLSALNPYN